MKIKKKKPFDKHGFCLPPVASCERGVAAGRSCASRAPLRAVGRPGQAPLSPGGIRAGPAPGCSPKPRPGACTARALNPISEWPGPGERPPDGPALPAPALCPEPPLATPAAAAGRRGSRPGGWWWPCCEAGERNPVLGHEPHGSGRSRLLSGLGLPVGTERQLQVSSDRGGSGMWRVSAWRTGRS